MVVVTKKHNGTYFAAYWLEIMLQMIGSDKKNVGLWFDESDQQRTEFSKNFPRIFALPERNETERKQTRGYTIQPLLIKPYIPENTWEQQ